VVAGWRASLELEYGERQGKTIPLLRRHEGPLRVQKGYYAEAPTAPLPWHQYIVHPPGGIAAGDQLTIRVHAQEHSHVLITTPGAAKWYRGDEASTPANQRVSLTASNAVLEWLPLETIFFSGASAQSAISIACDAQSSVIAADVTCFGRPASNETFDRGSIRLSMQLEVEGERVFFEQSHLVGGSGQFSSLTGLAQFPVMGQLIATSPRFHADDLAACRDRLMTLPEPLRNTLQFGATAPLFPSGKGSFIILRCRATQTSHAWQCLRTAWAVLRQRWLGLAVVEPRIWST
jgi:urease accessory protein